MKKATVWVDSKGNYYKNAADCAKSDGWFKCPKCHGVGTVPVKYNEYPSGLPDSGWAEDIRTRHDKCNICNGVGYTEVEKKAITKVVGYE